MRIEHVGFYEARCGGLLYAVGKLPTISNSDYDYQWAVCYENGEVDCYTIEGFLLSHREEDPSDIVRYLPTVKSWDDPIPPPEPTAVTVYTEWLSVGKECGRAWTGWTKGDVKPCYAVVRLRTVVVPANG